MFYPLHLPLPTQLPMMDWSEGSKARLGLLTRLDPLPDTVPAKEELPPFQEWCQSPYNFNEDGRPGVSHATYKSIEGTISTFLGFCYHFEGVALPYLSLRLFSNPVSSMVIRTS